MVNNATIAPLQLLVVAFDEPDFSGKIAEELNKVRDAKLIRIVDGLVVHKDKTGHIQTVEKSDLSFEEVGEYGAVLGALLGLGSGDENIVKDVSSSMQATFEERYEFGLDKEDVANIADELQEDSAALFLLIEHVWATPLRDAMRQANGVLLAQDFLSPELLIGIGAQAHAEAVSV
jgi:uncharacterized membrane protein